MKNGDFGASGGEKTADFAMQKNQKGKFGQKTTLSINQKMQVAVWGTQMT